MFVARDQPLAADAYHCVVIGSGPAGMAVALTLADANKRTLVLESESGDGDILPSIGYGHFGGDYWNGHSIRAFGGTSAAWSGWLAPLRAIDFDHPTIGVPWPMTLQDLAPFYRRAAAIFDRHPSIGDFRGRTVLPNWIYVPFSMQDPTRFGEKYREHVRTSRLIDVALGVSAVGFAATDARTAVSAVRCFDHRSKTPFDLALPGGKPVVIAAGGIGNAALLLQPHGGGVPIGNESGLAGLFLMEHPHAFFAGGCVLRDEMERYGPPRTYGHAIHTLALDPAHEAAQGMMGCSLNFYDRTSEHALVPFFSRPGVPAFHYSIDIRSEMRPTAANAVFATAERGRAGMHRVAARCVLSAEDFGNMDRTFRALGDALIAADLGRVRVNNDALYRDIMGGGHIMGTTRMGTSPANSVVDRSCRVHGYDNLFVAGSSVFPTTGFANPTFTIVALAVRLADEIAARG